jgi:endonuclease/exonuclease/phosphatase family metal-dependent hydrolase
MRRADTFDARKMERVRVVTLNMWGAEAPLEPRMAGIVSGLAALAPDIVGLQEVRALPGRLPNQADTLAAALGMEAHYVLSTPTPDGEEGLALLSRHPIAARHHRELPHAKPDERRVVVGVTVETPVGAFSAFTTHLNYRLTEGIVREDQVVAAEALVAETASELPKVLMGDFNAVPDADEIRFLRGLHSIGGRRVYYQDAFLRAHPSEAGYTWARRNPFTERLRFLEPDRRIDYIFVSPERKDGRGRIHDCRIVLDVADPDGILPSDHFGLCADLQLTPV